jgi:hypothetical protein
VQYVQAPPHQYNSVRYVHAPHAPTFQAPVQHYRTYAAPMALPAPQLQQYVPAPRVQFIAQYVPAPPMPMQVHTVSAPVPIQRELPRLSRTITLNNPENPYYNEYGVERYNRSETQNNSAANYEYMTVWLYSFLCLYNHSWNSGSRKSCSNMSNNVQCTIINSHLLFTVYIQIVVWT